MNELVPFVHCAGPHDARVVVIGEAHGETEEREGGTPFAGASGREFARMLIDAGWDEVGTLAAAVEERSDSIWLAKREEWLVRASVMLTNVFALRPTNNNLTYLCTAKSELPASYDLPPLRNENPRYVQERYLPHLSRLREEVERYRSQRTLLLLLGGPACWAVVGSHSIGRLRGAISTARASAPARIADGERALKVLPTFHPAAVLRAWEWRPVVLADLIKAKREREYSEIRRPAREVIIFPTIEEIERWTSETLAGSYRALAPDIETMNGQIRCIGFARSASEILVIPFIETLAGRSYWRTADDELRAWYAVRALLASDLPKIFQNGMFDLQYLARMGLSVRNASQDTMLLHHVLYPEMRKDLGFLGSVYTNEAAWKTMRLHKGEEELKRDE